MSMDQPNEYERAIEAYAEGVWREEKAKEALKAAQAEEEAARLDRQERWRVVSRYRADGKIAPGIYRLKGSSTGGMFAEGIQIEQYGDYPDVFPMFR